MILHLNKETPSKLIEALLENEGAFVIDTPDKKVVITSFKDKEATKFKVEPYLINEYTFSSDIQLASKSYINGVREVRLSDDIIIGGSTNNTVLIAGPCSVESDEQMDIVAQGLLNVKGKVLRGGCFKPRTSPYSFQGLGSKGLQILNRMKGTHGFLTITEVRDSTHVHEVINNTDIVQIGAKAMYDHGILKACGEARKPVMIKRGFGTTLQEFVQAAEFILSLGNPNVILCERGIRTFETKTRFTLDLCGVAYLKEFTNLPIILDPSHAMGHAYGVKDLSKACIAMGVDGLIVEVHPDPSVAKSDASQQLSFEQYQELLSEIEPIAKAVNRNLI